MRCFGFYYFFFYSWSWSIFSKSIYV